MTKATISMTIFHVYLITSFHLLCNMCCVKNCGAIVIYQCESFDTTLQFYDWVYDVNMA